MREQGHLPPDRRQNAAHHGASILSQSGGGREKGARPLCRPRPAPFLPKLQHVAIAAPGQVSQQFGDQAQGISQFDLARFTRFAQFYKQPFAKLSFAFRFHTLFAHYSAKHLNFIYIYKIYIFLSNIISLF